MTLGEKRKLFTRMLALLIEKMFDDGYECTLGDVMAKSGHCKNSLHYQGLAADINLFKDGKYLTMTEDHSRFGEYWKSLHTMCTWGGDFKSKDGNHYSFGEGK